MRAVLNLNERIVRFSMHGHARELYRLGIGDPADALLIDDRLPEGFRSMRVPQIRAQLAERERVG